MWIEQTKTGYRLCDRVRIDGKIKRVTVPLEKDTAQARRRATDALNKKIQGFTQPKSKKPLKDLSVYYWEHKDVKESTRTQNRPTFYGAIDALGDIAVGDLSAPYINRKYMECSKRPSVLNRYVNLLRTFIKWLYKYGYIDDDFSKKITTFKDHSPRKSSSDMYLESDEVSATLDQLSGMNKYVCWFLVLTGCRIGEAAALTMDDVGKEYISITKTCSPTGIVSTTKTETSQREIYIQPELAKMLKEYKEWRLLYLMTNGIRSNLLFFGIRGDRIRHATVLAALRHVDIGKPLHPHIFRHTHTALMAEQGVSLDAISRRLGHADSAITRQIYYHVTKKQREKDDMEFSKVSLL